MRYLFIFFCFSFLSEVLFFNYSLIPHVRELRRLSRPTRTSSHTCGLSVCKYKYLCVCVFLYMENQKFLSSSSLFVFASRHHSIAPFTIYEILVCICRMRRTEEITRTSNNRHQNRIISRGINVKSVEDSMWEVTFSLFIF